MNELVVYIWGVVGGGHKQVNIELATILDVSNVLVIHVVHGCQAVTEV